METDYLIELRNVTKKFGSRVILDKINLQVQSGDLITIMGKSGAGKTTLLNILGFFETITEGEYLFNGKTVRKNQTSVIRNRNIGFVFQSYNLISKMTVYENIVLPILYSFSGPKEKKQYLDRIPALLERYGIDTIKNEYVDHISGGEKQRVCLARALSCDAPLIISDEPTGNLDRQNTSVVLEELRKINQGGKTILIVTHDETVQDISSRRLLLQEGKLNEI